MNNKYKYETLKTAVPLKISEFPHSGNERIDRALEYLYRAGLKNFALGRKSIDDEISLIISENALKNKSDAKLEAHRKFIDIQFVIEGSEIFGLKDTDKCLEVKIPYNQEKDIMFFSDACDKYETLNEGEFIILPPDKAHAPCIGKGKVKKGIFKILAD